MQSFRKSASVFLAALLAASSPLQVLATSQKLPAAVMQSSPQSETTGDSETQALTSFMDGFLPMPIIGSLSDSAWGVPLTGARDQDNGLEDRTLEKYCYWDGTILKNPENGKYYMFASRWNESEGHGGWTSSSAVYATSDRLEGPYTDMGELWPDYYEGAGHNVFAFELSSSDLAWKEGYRYAISVSDTGKHGTEMNGSLHIAKSLDGPWEHLGVMDVDDAFRLSNISITVRPDGTYEAIGRDGDIATASSIYGPWTTQREELWWDIDGLDTSALEDPVIWYADDMYHLVVNNWSNKYAYYLTSYDGIRDWTLHSGPAYTAADTGKYIRYEDGTANTWTKLERPGVYLEDGTLKAMTFAVIDSEKEVENGNDEHGSKVIVVPYDGKSLSAFARSDEYTPAARGGLSAQADAHMQSWGDEADKNYGSETFLQLQGNSTQGVLGEGERPNSGYDCKIGFVRFDLSDYDLSKGADAFSSATLSLRYDAQYGSNEQEDAIVAAIADSSWIAGDGTDGGGGTSSIENALTWNRQPSVLTDGNGDALYGKAQSETFTLSQTNQEITLDVSSLLSSYMQANPDATQVTFALATKSGARIHVYSSEYQNDAYGPRLDLHASPALEKIAFDTDLLHLQTGQTQSLQVQFTPGNAVNKRVVFTSSNPAAATVNENGLVTAIAPGGTTIRAVSAEGHLIARAGVVVSASQAQAISIDPVSLIIPEGFDALLPAAVCVNYSDGSSKELPVSWQTEGKSISTAGTLEGSVEGIDLRASCTIKTATPLLSWVIDCNNSQSTRFINASRLSTLAHTVTDQAYSENDETPWGYVEEYGVHNSDNIADSYDSGWYAYSNQNIEYSLPLEAGDYQVTFGFKEWWSQYNSSRKMNLYTKQSDVRSELGTSNTWNGDNWWNTTTTALHVDAAGQVVLGVEKQSGQPDCVLSFLQVVKVLETSQLRTLINSLDETDLSNASDKQIEALDSLHAQALEALRNAATTQEQLDKIRDDIQKQLDEIGHAAFDEDDIAANDRYLYVFNCGTSDPSIVPDGVKKGLYQSSISQILGDDPLTGLRWGLEKDDANSITVASRNSTSLADSYLYMSPDAEYLSGTSGFRFVFELPERINTDYEITIGVQNPWDTRPLAVDIEDARVISALSAKKGTLVEQTCEVVCEDGELNVFVHNPDRTSSSQDPLISYVIVKAIAPWTKEQIEALLTSQAQSMEGHTYASDSLALYTSTKEAALDLIEQDDPSQSDLKAMLKQLEKDFGSLRETFEYTDFAGDLSRRWVDDQGRTIQAHGGQVQKLLIDGVEKWAWYGEDRASGYTPMAGVHLYTSTNLYNWKDEGVVLRTVPVSEEDYGKDQEDGYKADLSIFKDDPYFNALYGDYADLPAEDSQYENKAEETYWNLANDRSVLERPKVLYNKSTGKYVMWYHSDGHTPSSSGSYARARAGIAVSDSPTGPFKLVSTIRLYDSPNVETHGFDGQNGGALRDMNLFQDDDGTAYVIYSSDGNETLYIARLADDYLSLASDNENAVDGTSLVGEERENSDYIRAFSGSSREAPAMFAYNGKYYLMTSGCTGWDPNQAQYAMADHPLGPWTVMGDPCVDDSSNTTFHTQSTCFIPVDPANGKFIYMGDRWTRTQLGESYYVWLPVEFDQNGHMLLSSTTNWTLKDLNDKGIYTIETKLPETCSSLNEIKEILPDTIDYTTGTESKQSAVEWTVPSDAQDIPGTVTVSGTLESGRVIRHTISIVKTDTLYFFDCAKDGSSTYFETLASVVSGLKNQSADPRYAAGDDSNPSVSGLVSSSEGDSWDVHAYNGNDLFESGWYAGSGKSITYRIHLKAGEYTIEAGLREWWNTSRPMQLSASANGQSLASESFTLAGSDRNRVVSLSLNLDEECDVDLVVEKTGTADPVLSFLSVRGKEKEVLDFDALDRLIAHAEGLDSAQYTSNSFEAVASLLAQAKDIKENAQTQQAIDDAASALEEALNALISKEAANAIEEAISRYESLNRDSYLDTNDWTALDRLADQAKEAKRKAESSASLLEAASALNDALEALAKKPVLDFSQIDLLKAAFESLHVESFRAADASVIARAKTELEAAYALETQEDVDNKALAVCDMLLSLRRLPDANAPVFSK